MRLHFFTVNDIGDYRINYRDNKAFRKIFEEANHPQTLEELDQVYFFNLAQNPLPDKKKAKELLESEIHWLTGIDGLRLDFNFGLRLDIPEGNFRVRISDFDTEKICFDKNISGGRLISVEKYFIRWHVEVFLDGKKIFAYTLDLKDKPVILRHISDALGDTLAIAPYFRAFKKFHRCKLAITLPEDLRELVARLYPEIEQRDDFEPYATYYAIMFQSTPFVPITPVDLRKISMTRMPGVLLGINHIPPKAQFKPTAPRQIAEPYVCIGIQARNARKSWLWPNGWDIVVDYLKRLGYRVLCIDKDCERRNDDLTIRCPAGAEDFTGDRPLLERANMLYHAEFFIGLSSGLSWLAEAVDCPVVMICGFSLDWFEFHTPYRVMNRKVCHGCLNDCNVFYFTTDKCPYFKDTSRELECQKKISPRMVLGAIEQLIVDKNLIPPALR